MKLIYIVRDALWSIVDFVDICDGVGIADNTDFLTRYDVCGNWKVDELYILSDGGESTQDQLNTFKSKWFVGVGSQISQPIRMAQFRIGAKIYTDCVIEVVKDSGRELYLHTVECGKFAMPKLRESLQPSPDVTITIKDPRMLLHKSTRFISRLKTFNMKIKAGWSDYMRRNYINKDSAVAYKGRYDKWELERYEGSDPETYAAYDGPYKLSDIRHKVHRIHSALTWNSNVELYYIKDMVESIEEFEDGDVVSIKYKEPTFIVERFRDSIYKIRVGNDREVYLLEIFPNFDLNRLERYYPKIKKTTIDDDDSILLDY